MVRTHDSQSCSEGSIPFVSTKPYGAICSRKAVKGRLTSVASQEEIHTKLVVERCEERRSTQVNVREPMGNPKAVPAGKADRHERCVQLVRVISPSSSDEGGTHEMQVCGRRFTKAWRL